MHNYNKFKKLWDRSTEDFVSKNYRDVKHSNKFLEQRVVKAREHTTYRVKSTQERRRELAKEEAKFKYFLLHKWEIIKDRKKDFELAMVEVRRKRH